MRIWAHTLVKNEAKWIWYSVSSVVNHVDKVLLWDTGSTDKTPEIIKELVKSYPGKIDFKQYGGVTPETFTKARQEMLNVTDSDWFITLDADEIWWEESIKKVVDEIISKGNKMESIVVPAKLLVGDIFHYQEEKAGKYRLAGRKGHYSLRAINRTIPGLQALKPHGQMGWADGEGRMIQDRDSEKIIFLDAPFLHATHLPRATELSGDTNVIKRKKKLKYEIGVPFPKDFYFPEVFFRPKPEIVQSPWKTMDVGFKIRALVETPLRKIKRRIWKGGEGY